jgi:hypothetical protein
MRYSRPEEQILQSVWKHICRPLKAVGDAEEEAVKGGIESARNIHLDAFPKLFPWQWIVLIYQIRAMPIINKLAVQCNLVTTIAAVSH